MSPISSQKGFDENETEAHNAMGVAFTICLLIGIVVLGYLIFL